MEIYKSTIGNFSLYSFESEHRESNVNIKQYVVLDNSISMGSNTKKAMNTIVKGLLDISNDITVVVFSTNVSFYHVSNENDLSEICLPRQGNTNITSAILDTFKDISVHSPDDHYLVTFLSDGEHNCGPEINDLMLSTLKNSLNGFNITFNVVGIVGSNTSLGMKIKTYLETTRINSLQSVYYCHSSSDQMISILNEMVKGCNDELKFGTSLKLELFDGIFIENKSNKLNVFLSEELNILSTRSSELKVNGQIVQTIEKQINYEDLEKIINYLVPKLSQLKIAKQEITEHVRQLNELINNFESMLKEVCQYSPEDIGQLKIRPGERLKMIKSLKSSNNFCAEQRNRLNSLLIQINNSSATQAEYLTGINKKFASKAILRSKVFDKTDQQVNKEILNSKDDMILCSDLYENTDECSFLSLLSPKEQLSEWIDSYNLLDETTDIYSKLVLFGFPGYPVEFFRNNAVQMDAYQTSCTYIEPYLLDSSSLFLANRSNVKIYTPSRKQVTDVLFLIDPSCPLLCLAAKYNVLYQYLCSVTLCRDLYMYSGKMPLAIHSHALLKSCQHDESVYKTLSLKILYSYSKIYRKNKLFDHWIDENELTQSQEDECDHPVQLLPMIVCHEKIENYPLINLLNEAMARHMKIILRDLDEDSEMKAIRLLKETLGINSGNCPKPDADILKEEPTLESVRESCMHWSEINTNSELFRIINGNIANYVNRTLLPYVRCFQFCLFVKNNISFDEIERLGRIPEEMANCCALTNDIYSYLEISDIELVSKNILFQAMLKHTSSTRKNVVNQNVFDSATLQELIKDLRMTEYFEACKVKREKWMKMIGNVTYERAVNGSVEEFDRILVRHTHGFSKQEFWALFQASKSDEEKKKTFIKRSNQTIPSLYERK